jgi:N-acetylmuramic acid 6-phosphate etherase
MLDAYECPPTFGIPAGRVQAILAGGDAATHGSFEEAEDDAPAGAEAMRQRNVSSKDVVVGIAASGRTPFVWGALGAARERGAKTILLCFNPKLRFPSTHRPTLIIIPRTGPEVLTGSTRLKAGTATKMLLNTFSTLAMVRLGKVMENLMVDVQPSNAKLRERAIRIVRELTGTSRDDALAALRRHEWSAKNAVATLRRTRSFHGESAKRQRSPKS